MKALISGITGFIGSHVAELLLDNGENVIGVSHSTWLSTAPAKLKENVSLVSWDITKPADKSVLSTIRRFDPDVVFHFAGISIPYLCGRESPTEQALSVNVTGTNHVLDLACQLPEPRFIFASTCHVYDRVTRNAPVVSEDAPIQPGSAYGQTKLQSEREILRRVSASELNACIVRGFHHIGPRQPNGLMLTDWLGQVRDPQSRMIEVRCDNSYLDLIDVRDAARGYSLVAQKGDPGGIYNMGSGKITKSGDVLGAILELVPREFQVKVGSTEEQWNPIADISKLQSLGWSPTTNYETTIRDMLSAD